MAENIIKFISQIFGTIFEAFLMQFVSKLLNLNTVDNGDDYHIKSFYPHPTSIFATSKLHDHFSLIPTKTS